MTHRTKKAKALPSVRLTITVTTQAAGIIRRLHATGLYGLTVTHAARELLYRSLREAKPILDVLEDRDE